MKKTTLLILSFLVIIYGAKSQTCLPEGKYFTNQIEIDNFQTYYPGCTKIEGQVTISGSEITNLSGLSVLFEIGGSLDITNNTQLESLFGLDNLEAVGSTFSIYENPMLKDITSLSKIDSVHDDLYIETNEKLESLEGLHNIKHVNGFVDILVQHRLKELNGLRSLVTVSDYFYISKMDSIQDFSGMDKLRQTGGISVSYCPMFKDFKGLSSIEKPGDIQALRMDNLESFAGLEGVDTINSLRASNAEKLSNLQGFENLKFVNDFVKIEACDNIITLGGLESVSVIKQIIVRENPEIISLRGIDGVDPNQISRIEIHNNPKLSLCEVQSICEYISLPNIVTDVHDNAQKCNSVAEIDTACLYSSVSELTFSDLFSVYPNPSSYKLYIEKYNGAKVEEVILYNQYGQSVLWVKDNPDYIEVENLTSGVYLIEILFNNYKLRSKIIIN